VASAPSVSRPFPTERAVRRRVWATVATVASAMHTRTTIPAITAGASAFRGALCALRATIGRYATLQIVLYTHGEEDEEGKKEEEGEGPVELLRDLSVCTET
jgi:hypothetical protein